MLPESTVPVGRMHINTVATLTKLDNGTREGTHVVPSLWDLDLSDEPTNGKVAMLMCTYNKVQKKVFKISFLTYIFCKLRYKIY